MVDLQGRKIMLRALRYAARRGSRCTLPFADHPIHGPCTTHMGFMHLAWRNGVRYAWPHCPLPDGGKRYKEKT